MIKHIASESFGITFQLKSIYVYENKFYFHLELKNASNVSYPIDLISFKIVDQKTAKRTAIQEKELVPLRMFLPVEPIATNSIERNVFFLDQFTWRMIRCWSLKSLRPMVAGISELRYGMMI